ncbi:phytoene dehydrogenase [Mycobacterium kiyosense]|uniref:Phytoene dehydrogenase n=1 Tax=Mycobacterium kiyosense TaxID=2871094 RepID=A0A9P3Q5X8_9MYCO|nr:phytoene dehydrogenase [Mycobacterium kiyosense]BDE12278.1 phytoene dehydrogenase [Mycobacterium sp. 20KCMC460]GLB85116.1 phytoene dehydrogenase [Mycobacterium kiyosense]GLB88516.1 phytoene dehydrogenase [Mycobacterium kiyosense]GLB94855.1 phytoene dehydrogenase [Mycobacterium kiyosense]
MLAATAATAAAAALSGTVPAGRAATNKSVAVFGAGVAGLTAAHELAERGYAVTVYERKALGGKARSIPVPNTGPDPLPAEHGFRFFPGFYRNVPDTMRRIPFAGNANGVWNNLTRATSYLHSGMGRADLTIPLPFPLPTIPNPITPKAFIESVTTVFQTLFRLPLWEAAYAAQKLAVYVTSCTERKLGQWDNMTWSDYIGADKRSAEYNRYLADGIIRNLAASKSKDASAHSIGLVGEASVWSILLFGNDTDCKGFDRVLNGPTSAQWLDPWIAHLTSMGVTFRVGQALSRLNPNGNHIASATVTDVNGLPQPVVADWYVSAIPCEKLAAVLTPDVIAADPGLANVALLRTEWMNGLMFYLKERVDVTKGHVNYVDSGWGLTSISQEQFWKRSLTTYGDGTVKDCLSAIISDWSTPGNFNRKSARQCTPTEIAQEAWAQIKAHLSDTGHVVDDSMLHSWFLDPSIIDSGTPNVRNDEPLFIQDPGSWGRRPNAVTGIDNLFLAGEWIRTDQNVTTMEGANEGGRYAANGVLQASGYSGQMVNIVKLFQAPWWEPIKAVDQARYRKGLPNALDILDTRRPGQ